MVSSFNYLKLKELIMDLYNVTGLRITVFDTNYREILSYPDPLPEFCKLIRTSKEGTRQCYECDKTGCEISTRQEGTYIYQCHAGLTEVIAPIILGKIIAGYLCFGHILPKEDKREAWEIVSEKIAKYNLPMDKMYRAFDESIYRSDDYLKSGAQLLQAVASYVCVSHMTTLKKDDLPFQIDTYINDHLSDVLDSDVLCERFRISRAKLYQISKSNFGMGITEYIRNLRIRCAQDFLLHTDDSINIIANKVGINDYNYFTKVFKREVGQTPSQFRKNEVGFWQMKRSRK